jgi:putative aldouronate transport system substrate-binding protein
VRPDWPSVDTGTYGNAIRNGQAGVLVDVMDSGRRIWDYFETNKIPSVTDPSKIASMNLLGPINNKTLATAGHNGYMMISKAGAKTEQDVKNVLHFLDKMNDNVMLVLADRGLEGIQWNFDDEGYVIPITPSPYTVQNSPQLGLNQVVAYIPNTASTDPTTKLTEREVAQNEAYYKMRPLAVTNPAAGLLPNSTVQAEVGTQLAQILEDARTQYICGVIDDAGLQAAFKTWADRGGTRLIAEINALR